MTEIRAEEVLGRETVFAGKLITVRKDTVRLPNGKTTEREVVEHAEVAVIIPVLDDGRLVLVRQYREAVGKALLEIPAGGVDEGESAEEAARREMVEETGYRVGRLDRLCSFYSSPGFCTELMHLYVARGLEPGEPTEENDELEVVLLTQEDAMQRLQRGEIQDAKTVAALGVYGRPHEPQHRTAM
jgi:ADP-ribose pyrophosphatase